MPTALAPLLLLLAAEGGLALKVSHTRHTRRDLVRLGCGAAAASLAVGPAQRAASIPPLTPEQLQDLMDGKTLTQVGPPSPPPPPPSPPLVYYTPPGVKGESTPEQIALAKHLKKRGAKFYGAYWCQFCYEQKVAFGAGGTRLLNYVECAEDGYESKRKTCQSKSIQGYPTWEIGGKLYPGFKSLDQLKELSGFKG